MKFAVVIDNPEGCIPYIPKVFDDEMSAVRYVGDWIGKQDNADELLTEFFGSDFKRVFHTIAICKLPKED